MPTLVNIPGLLAYLNVLRHKIQMYVAPGAGAACQFFAFGALRGEIERRESSNSLGRTGFSRLFPPSLVLFLLRQTSLAFRSLL